MRLSLTSLTLALAAVPALVAQESAPDPAPRPQLAYQGRLLEAGQPVTGTRTFTFLLLDPQGAELWNSGPLPIGVSNGLYAVVLGGGDQPAIPNGIISRAGLKLRMVLGTQPMSPDVDLVPALQARSAFEVTGAFGGDVKGTQSGLAVIRLQGVPLDAANPGVGQGLVFNGTAWVPGTVAGTPGPKGDAGPQGEKGEPGARGPAGPKGDTGAASTVPGPTGPQGSVGPMGPTGPQGAKGDTGLQGLLGPKGDTGAASTVPGPMGPQGSMGPTGPAGPQGVRGETGIQGVKGDTGTQGLLGPKGDTGAASTVPGPMGPQGATGPVGPAGPQGVKGDAGIQGVKGDTGLQGLQGPKGDTGAASTVPGPMGPQGSIGPMGPAGPQGVKGDTGATGASGGRTLLSGAVDPSVGDGSDGDFWLNTVTSKMFGPKVSGAWAAGWSIKGNPGDTGAPGAKGDQGLQGIQGLKGDTGATGAAGPQGPAGSGAFQVDAGTGAATYTGGTVGVGTAAPAATAKMDITSTTQGFLPPRMTQAQREAIPSPAEGLMVYQTDGAKGIYVFDGSAWRSLQEPRSVTFSYNGTAKDYRGVFYGTDGSAQAWTVPAGVTSVTIECWGAQGGGNPTNGGKGGYAKGTLAVTAGQAFQIWVGGQSGILNSGGFSGGVSGTADTDMKGYGFPGGGKSTVQLNGQSIITAGGGGGAALNLWNGYLGLDLWITGGSGGGPEGSGFFFTTNAAGGDGGGEPPYSPGRANMNTGKGGPGYLNPTLTNASMASGMRTGHGQVVITY